MILFNVLYGGLSHNQNSLSLRVSFSLSLSHSSTLVHYRMISLSISSTSVHYRMNLCAPYPPSLPSTFNSNSRSNSNQILYPKPKSSLSCNFKQGGQWPFNSSPAREESIDKLRKSLEPDYSCGPKFCSCGRKRFIEGTGTTLFSTPPSNDFHSHPDPSATMNSIRPPRPDWYEEFLASIMDWGMKSYEAEVASYKSQLFTNLRGKAKTVLEIGIGTGPNLKYYAGDNDIVQVFGTDPNRKMEKYAQTAALNAGLPPTNFEFIQAVAEALPLSDASVDAVVGTLVLCSVADVNRTLKEVMRVLKPGGLYLFLEHVAAKDGTILRFLQGVLKPLQQALGDGCHITRTTGKYISEAEGFSDVEMKTASIGSLPLISPHVYGIARK